MSSRTRKVIFTFATLLVTILKVHSTAPTSVRGLSSKKSNDNVFKIIVLAGNQPSMLNGLLESIASTNFSGDVVSLEIRIGGNERRNRELSELVASGFSYPDSVIEKNVVYCDDNDARGSVAAWVDAWSEPTGDALILDVSMKLSPHWYEYVRDAWKQYKNRSDVAGISLTRQAVTTSLQTPMKPYQIINNHEPFFFDMVVGPSAFSPHPDRWREFLNWVQSVDFDDLTKNVPNLMAHLITMKKFRSVVFYHTRKAGGSSMKLFLKDFTRRNRKALKVIEGNIATQKYLNLDTVLSLTMIRDPIERAISSYEFEGRYPIGVKDVSDLTPVDFDTWMTEFAGDAKWRSDFQKCWVCSSECFNNWFGGDKKGGYNHEVAKDTLAAFDMVLPLEAMSHPVYKRFLQRIFDHVDGPMRHMNPTREERKEEPISEEQLERLRELNRDDQRLVEPYMGTKEQRESYSVEEWWEMMDETTMWTMWTQLFTYWCQLSGLHILHLAPHDEYAMAVSRHAGEDGGEFADFLPLPESSPLYDQLPLKPRQYGLDGGLLEGVTDTN